MLKLIALLCAAMFGVLLIAGEDRGQMRPGLANAPLTPLEVTSEPAQVVLAANPVAAADAAPADVASVSAPVTITPPATPATEPVNEDSVFSLATYSDEPLEQPLDQSVAAPQNLGDLAWVDAASVNVREGPGTDNPVLTKLSRGEAVTIVSVDQTGWARIRLEGDGLEGFMSMEYLSATAP